MGCTHEVDRTRRRREICEDAGQQLSTINAVHFRYQNPSGMSLSQTDGHKKLKQLINDAQQASFADAANDNHHQELFEVAPKKKKKPARSRTELVEARESLEHFDITLGNGEQVTVLRPSHPHDDVWMQLWEEALKSVFEFIRVNSESQLEARPRNYIKKTTDDGDGSTSDAEQPEAVESAIDNLEGHSIDEAASSVGLFG